MKKIFPIFLLLIGFILTSCQTDEEMPTSELNTTQIDSLSNKEYNLVWKNRYYQLEFDYALARISNYTGIAGTGPAYIMYDAYFNDKNSTAKFVLTTGVGWSMHGDCNHFVYNTDEVQSRLDGAQNRLSVPFNSTYTHGTKMRQMYSPPLYTGDYVFPKQNFIVSQQQWVPEAIQLEVMEFATYYQGADKYADFTLKISGDSVQGTFSGKFKAQEQ